MVGQHEHPRLPLCGLLRCVLVCVGEGALASLDLSGHSIEDEDLHNVRMI